MTQENKYSYDEASVQAIVEWARTVQLPKEAALSESEHITDTSLYVHANICGIFHAARFWLMLVDLQSVMSCRKTICKTVVKRP